MTTFVIFAALGSRHAFIMEQTVARRPVHPFDHLQGTAARLANLLPDAAHHRLAEWLKHPHTHPDLDPAIRTLLAVRDWRGGKKAFSHDPVLARARFRREMLMIRPQPTPVGEVIDLMIDGAVSPLAARLYRPIEAKHDQHLPLLVFLHGGGYVVGEIWQPQLRPIWLVCRMHPQHSC
jgi:acetyl esterase/lipase